MYRNSRHLNRLAVPHRSRRVTSWALLTLVTVGGCGPQRTPPSAFETTKVTQTALTQTVTASGTLSAVVSVDVGSQVTGKITHVDVDFNSPVRRGQVIAEIDTTLYAATLHQSEGELASARANVTLKQQNLERKRMLVPERAASQFDLDQATAELAQAQAAVVMREAAVQSARANVAFCKITAPVDGTVIARKIDVGQTVISAMNSPVLFTIARNLREMHINAAVSEADVGLVRVGQPVDFTVDAYPTETFSGRVTQVRKSPTTSQNVVTYETIVLVANPEEKLFPGMTATLAIRVADRDRAITIANTALRFIPPTGTVFSNSPPTRIARSERLVYLPSLDGTSLRPVIVVVGISDGVRTEILKGLGLGTPVVTSAPRVVAQKRGVFPPSPSPSAP